MNLLGWRWFTTLYRFQVYKSIKHYWQLHHMPIDPSKASFHPISPPLCPPPPTPTLYLTLDITTVFYVFVLYIHTYVFYGLIPSPSSIQFPILFPSDGFQTVCYNHASIYILFVHLFCSLDSMYKWDHMLFAFLWLVYFT